MPYLCPWASRGYSRRVYTHLKALRPERAEREKSRRERYLDWQVDRRTIYMISQVRPAWAAPPAAWSELEGVDRELACGRAG
jgi:hypothetical protein